MTTATHPVLGPLHRAWKSSSFRLALCFSAVVVSILVGTLSVYYVEIVGTVSQRLDDYALRNSKRLLSVYAQQGEAGLVEEIQRLVSDGIDSQDEIFIYQHLDGAVWAGNATIDLVHAPRVAALQDLPVEQEARSFNGRVKIDDLGQQRFLIVGSDLQALTDIQHRYMKATALALGLAVGLSLLGAMVFRRLMDKRAAEVRQAIRQAGQGNLHFRIPMNRKSDEFSLLEQDINQMLEQLEQLVRGIRHVSHMVAHNLRTPLNRALHRVQAAKLAPESLRPALLDQVQEELDHLQRLFSKMLLLVLRVAHEMLGQALEHRGCHPGTMVAQPQLHLVTLALQVHFQAALLDGQPVFQEVVQQVGPHSPAGASPPAPSHPVPAPAAVPPAGH